MKCGQNVCLNKVSDKFENGSCRVKKNVSLGEILEKKLVYVLEAIFSVQYPGNLVKRFALMKSWIDLKLGHVGFKTKSLGQILENLV